jgi:chromosome segregation ATPase
MAQEPRVGPEQDLDRTDTLPAFAGVAKARSEEERVARQTADFAALGSALERSQGDEATAEARGNALALELAALRDALATERDRNRESERVLLDKVAEGEWARASLEAGRHETIRLRNEIAALTVEARTFTDALAARDAKVAQVMNSLAERDAQLMALQREHAHVVPDLQARVAAGQLLQAQLEAAEARAAALQLDLDRRDAAIATLTAQVARGESARAEDVRELMAVRAQSATYLEALQSREWRRSYEHSRWHESDAAPQALQTALLGLESQREEFRRKLAEVAAAQGVTVAAVPALTPPATANDGADPAAAQHKIDAQAGEIAALKVAVDTAQQEVAVLLAHLQAVRRQQAQLGADTSHVAEAERLTKDLAARSARVVALERENRELLVALDRARGALDERELLISRLERSESSNANAPDTSQTAISSRAPIVLEFQSDAVSVESAAEAGGHEPAAEAGGHEPAAEAGGLEPAAEAGSLEPAAEAGSLEPAAEAGGHEPAAEAGGHEPAAEGAPGKLVRVDSGSAITHVLQRRNRVGRAPGTEVHINSSTVSRLHALIVSAPGGAIIEDVNSTNGTYVNGQRVTRQVLREGDLLTIGEAQFRFSAETRRPAPGTRAAPATSGALAEQ